ncbi:hypothetical protein FBU31_000784 [Coemansia sp. 'formosensis']|nr:hypothetical protein FBU31_000784 [Coemansia sp. 'formosensis']
MSSYTFRYFKVAGFGETSRLLLTAAQVEWIEENPEWPQEKPNQPFGRLPVLIERSADSSPDLILSESATIERYIARTYGFLPADPRQAALQEQLRDRINDVILAYIASMSVKDDAKAEAQAKFEGLLDKLVAVHSELLRKNGDNGHLFGSTLSFADIATYAFLRTFLVKPIEILGDSPRLVKAKLTPELAKLAVTVERDPLLEAYAAKNGMLADLVQV